MSGFRYCPWCHGGGCMCCDAEEKKFKAKVAANAPKWRAPDVRDLRDAVVQAEFERGMTPGIRAISPSRIDALTESEVESAFKPLLDAEYDRQFTNGPEPMLTIKTSDPASMDLLKSVMHIDVLKEAFGPGGRGMADIEERAAKAREIQASRVTTSEPTP